MSSLLPTSALLTESWQVVEYINDLLSENAGELGLAYVGVSAHLNREYPAAIVIPNSKVKDMHATHTFNVHLLTDIAVYHARLTADRTARTIEDLELCTRIENLIEQGEMNFGGTVIFAYVVSIIPGTLVRPKGEQVVGSRMTIEVLSQKRFPYAN